MSQANECTIKLSAPDIETLEYLSNEIFKDDKDIIKVGRFKKGKKFCSIKVTKKIN